MKFDVLIVGAGLSGCTLAERLASQQGKRVLIVDKRNHIGGNCHDYHNEDGILVHHYGPHYFRTNSKRVWDYLSQFTPWHYLQYRVQAYVEGQCVNFPVNLDTFNQLYGTTLSASELAQHFEALREVVGEVHNSRDQIVSQVGFDLYDKFFKNYTKKQWDLWPEELDASVCARIPVRTNRDNRYFGDRYQAMPKQGYHRMFERMLDHPNISILLQTDYRDVVDLIQPRSTIYTGPIDEFFDFRYGKLPYRSLRFEHETINTEQFQPVSQINYPNDYDFTRVVEIKHVTGQIHPKTTIVREYPEGEGEPFYPVPTAENHALFERYWADAQALKNVHFLGRLAEYRYFNMDQVVKRALEVFDSIATISNC